MTSKLSTGLTGLHVAKDPHKMLKMFYNMTLKYLTEMPKEAVYRQSTENLTKKRLDLVNKEQDISKLEQKIGCGQIEEVIIQAHNELELAKKMVQWRPWEQLMEKPPKNQWKWPI